MPSSSRKLWTVVEQDRVFLFQMGFEMFQTGSMTGPAPRMRLILVSTR